MICIHTEGEKHSCTYVELRNQLIEKAAARATALAGDVRDEAPKTPAEAAMQQAWNRAFAAEMESLWGET